ncbi:DUF4349 domain-containing protein [Streptomyces apocyni]|uniref:DUF4349 domain-containing protein n=1 Tax=Streptomyces apocyni TaxID=2654677 RepID=UPI0012E9ADBC|nr:DUF4349 domain-containing protein [Streptomyces apocyni]
MRASTRSRSRFRSRSRSRRQSTRALTALLLAAAVAVGGCSGDRGSDGAKSRSDSKAGAAEDAAGGDQAASGSGSKSADRQAPDPVGTHIIRTATLTVRVKDVPKALGAARDATLDAGGGVGSETTNRDRQGRERSRLVLRVPQAKYHDVLRALAGTGKVVERKLKEENVTEQVVDVESRVKSQRASVARVRELMDQATKLSDVVTLEGELSSRQADLESLLARQASLKDRVTLATITLQLNETGQKQQADKDDDPTFVSALKGGWNAFVTGLRWITIALGAVLPFAAAAALLLVLWRLVRARLIRGPVSEPASAGSDTPDTPDAPDTPDTPDTPGRD